jgi:hypothetical protein
MNQEQLKLELKIEVLIGELKRVRAENETLRRRLRQLLEPLRDMHSWAYGKEVRDE